MNRLNNNSGPVRSSEFYTHTANLQNQNTAKQRRTHKTIVQRLRKNVYSLTGGESDEKIHNRFILQMKLQPVSLA